MAPRWRKEEEKNTPKLQSCRIFWSIYLIPMSISFSLIVVNNNNFLLFLAICIVQLATVHQIFTPFYFSVIYSNFWNEFSLVCSLLPVPHAVCFLSTKNYVYFIVCLKWCALFYFFFILFILLLLFVYCSLLSHRNLYSTTLLFFFVLYL